MSRPCPNARVNGGRTVTSLLLYEIRYIRLRVRTVSAEDKDRLTPAMSAAQFLRWDQGELLANMVFIYVSF